MTSSGRATRVQPWVYLPAVGTVRPRHLDRCPIPRTEGRRAGLDPAGRSRRMGWPCRPARSTSSKTPPCSSCRPTPPATHGPWGRLLPPGASGYMSQFPSPTVYWVLAGWDSEPSSALRQRKGDQVSGLSSSSGSTRGSAIRKTDPTPSSLFASTSPPWASATCLTIARPRPVPPVCRERATSTR